MNHTNPFAPGAVTEAAPITPSAWAAPSKPIPVNAAIDMTTGDVLLHHDGTPWDRDALLNAWRISKERVEQIKASEMELRLMVTAVFSTPEVRSGTERVELGNGYELKLVKSINYNVKSKHDGVSNTVAVQNALAKLKLLPHGDLIGERVIKTKFELSLTEYKQLTPEMKAIIDDVVETTDGAPKVDIIAPKEKK